MLIYNNQGKQLTLPGDIEVFSYVTAVGRKMNGYYISYQESGCNGVAKIICIPIIIETPENIVAIVHKNDTMNISIKNYSDYGFELFIDSIVFCKGWHELKNENSVGYNNKGQYVVENNINLKYDTCFFNLARISVSNIIPFTPASSTLIKNEIKKSETISSIVNALAQKVEIIDSLGTKYIK